MVKYIINADDLGLSPAVNQAIDKYLSEGLISSSTIMANTRYWSEVEAICAKHPEASFGVHLNLTQGPSMTNSPILHRYGLTDDNGYFVHIEKDNIKFTDELVKAIQEEWQMQIQTVFNHQIPISHLDGHHHVHAWFELETVLIRLCHEFKVKRVRNRYTVPFSEREKVTLPSTRTTSRKKQNGVAIKRQSILSRIFTSLKLRLESSLWRWRLSLSGIHTTDYFHYYESIYNMLKSGGRFPSNCTVELMSHPGHEKFIEENKLIEDRGVTTLSEGTLISYNQLK